MTLIDYEKKTLQWSYDRGITVNGNVTTQAMKLISEAGELALNLVKSKCIKDDIGDCLVVLTNLSVLSNNIKVSAIQVDFEKKPLLTCLGDLCDNIIKNKTIVEDIKCIFNALKQYAEAYDYTLTECWAVAWDDIKDRKGFLNEHGNFIKSTDKAYEQALIDFEARR
jgi:hypothetical protein